MSHNLEIRNGAASFFTVREKAWHNLGTVLQDCPNLEQAIEQGKLNYEVEKRELQTVDGLNVPDKYATVRTDTNDVLGVVGSGYKVIQNIEAFSFFDFLQDEACFETGGVLHKGQIAWLSCKLPSHFSIAGQQDVIEQYLFLYTSHDGSKALQAMFTPVRVVCNNTLNAALRHNANKISIRHTRNATDKIKQAHKVMGIVNQLSEEMKHVFKAMHQTKVTDQQVYNLIQLAVTNNKEVGSKEDLSTRATNIIDEVINYYHLHETQKELVGTAYGVYNAITGYNQNIRKQNEERKMTSLLNGNKTEQNVFNNLLKLI